MCRLDSNVSCKFIRHVKLFWQVLMGNIILSKLVTDQPGLLLSCCADQLRGNMCINKGDQNVRYFSQFKDIYGKLRDELGFFPTSCLSFFLVHVALKYASLNRMRFGPGYMSSKIAANAGQSCCFEHRKPILYVCLISFLWYHGVERNISKCMG